NPGARLRGSTLDSPSRSSRHLPSRCNGTDRRRRESRGGRDPRGRCAPDAREIRGTRAERVRSAHEVEPIHETKMQTEAILSPYDGSVVGHMPVSGEAEIEAAIARAQRA